MAEPASARRVPGRVDLTLVVTGLVAGYPGGPPIVRGVTLEFGPGVTLLIGPNGAGKSTLLKSIVGMARVMDGTVVANGEEIQRLQPWKAHRAGVSLVPQGRCNFPRMSVHENLELGVTGLVRADRHARVDEMYERFPMLRDKRRQLAGNLSGGEQQILEMAMVLEARPRVLLIDEPSLGLSPHAQDQIFEVIRGVADAGTPVVLAEQNVLRAARRSDRAIVLIAGRLAADVAASDVVDGSVDLHEAFLGRVSRSDGSASQPA